MRGHPKPAMGEHPGLKQVHEFVVKGGKKTAIGESGAEEEVAGAGDENNAGDKPFHSARGGAKSAKSTRERPRHHWDEGQCRQKRRGDVLWVGGEVEVGGEKEDAQ